MASRIVAGRLLPGIQGLRGISALAIVAYHVNQMARLELPRPLGFIGWEFGHAVHLFFVISAFSLLHSRSQHAGDPRGSSRGRLVEYGIRRIFRIAPLFYAVLLWYLVFDRVWVDHAYSVADVLLNFSLLFGLSGAQSSSLVWGGWTVGVEMLFYLIFPALAVWCRSSLATVVAVALTSAGGYAAHRAITAATSARDADAAFPSNLAVFLFGFLAFRLFASKRASRLLDGALLPCAALVLIAALCLVGRQLRAPGRPDLLLWSAAFAVLCAWQARRPSKIVSAGFLSYVGERSFSVYLLHPQVLWLMWPALWVLYTSTARWIGAWAYLPCLGLATIVTLAVSEISYRAIEVPGIRMGRALIERRRAQPENGRPASFSPLP